MVVARVSTWKFKQGQRDNAFAALDKRSEEADRTRGFRGYLDLLSDDDPDAAIVITLWEDEETRSASQRGIFQGATQDMERYLTGPPDVKNYRVREIQIKETPPEIAKPM
jgi:heme-degrading monooxygenase HmoA